MKKYMMLLTAALIFVQCGPTGLREDYSWSRSEPDLFQGKSLFDLWETPVSDYNADIKDVKEYLDFFDYPGSRDKVKKAYWYSYEKKISRPMRPGSGINMGSALDAPHEGAWGIVLHESYFTEIRKAGFQIVRLPVRFQTHISDYSPLTLDQSFLERVDWAVNCGLNEGLIVILDFHHYIEPDLYMFSSPEEEEASVQLFLEIWDIIARRYKDYPENLYFELFNEPHLPFSRELWNSVSGQVITNIRSTGGNNSTRTLVVGCGTWSHVGALEYLDIPSVEEDPNIIVTFHYYEPLSFTHQSVDWGPMKPLTGFWKGNVWTGTEKQKELVRRDFDLAADWAEEHHRQLLLSEFGARQEADKMSRVLYTGYVRQMAEERGFLWTYWSFHSADPLGICDPARGWKTEILDALIPEDSDSR